MTKLEIKQDELIDALFAYSTHVVIMWNKDLEDDESKDLKLRLWENVKKIKGALALLKAESKKERPCESCDEPIPCNLECDKELSLRDELIRFTQQFYADEETCIHNVDKYLASNTVTTHDLNEIGRAEEEKK
jgi:hypothetical protein